MTHIPKKSNQNHLYLQHRQQVSLLAPSWLDTDTIGKRKLFRFIFLKLPFDKAFVEDVEGGSFYDPSSSLTRLLHHEPIKEPLENPTQILYDLWQVGREGGKRVDVLVLFVIFIFTWRVLTVHFHCIFFLSLYIILPLLNFSPFSSSLLLIFSFSFLRFICFKIHTFHPFLFLIFFFFLLQNHSWPFYVTSLLSPLLPLNTDLIVTIQYSVKCDSPQGIPILITSTTDWIVNFVYNSE